MAGRPGKNYSYGGRRSGRLIGSLISGAPKLEEDPQNTGVEGPTKSGATLDPTDEGEAKLRARGIKTPVYKKPGFFTNLLTAGAAGEQAWDANTRAMSEKNRMLADIATEESRQAANERLEQTRHGNSMAATNNAAVAQMLAASGVVVTPENIAAWNAANSGRGIAAGGAELQQRMAKSLLGALESGVRQRTIEENPQVFSQENIDKARTAGITNTATADANLRANQLQPSQLSEAEFSVANQPERREQLIASNAAQKIANEQALEQKPFWGTKIVPNDSWTMFGKLPGGTPITEKTPDRNVWDTISVPSLIKGQPPTEKQIHRTIQGGTSYSIIPGISEQQIEEAARIKKLLGERQ